MILHFLLIAKALVFLKAGATIVAIPESESKPEPTPEPTVVVVETPTPEAKPEIELLVGMAERLTTLENQLSSLRANVATVDMVAAYGDRLTALETKETKAEVLEEVVPNPIPAIEVKEPKRARHPALVALLGKLP